MVENMANKYINFHNLELYKERVNKCLNTDMDTLMNAKLYADKTISFKSTHCPNCAAPITSSKCPYCDTDFKQSAIWGKELL